MFVPPTQYPVRFYEMLYPREVIETKDFAPWKVKFLVTGIIVTDPERYIYKLECQRVNPKVNFADPYWANILETNYQRAPSSIFSKYTVFDTTQILLIKRVEVYRYLRNYIETLDRDTHAILCRFPRYEKLGLSKDIRDGYVKLITLLNMGEYVPSLRKGNIKEFQATLHNLNTYFNFAYNRNYISFHQHGYIAGKLAQIGKLHTRYVDMVLNKSKGEEMDNREQDDSNVRSNLS